jgi:hypothetical protein
MHKRLKYSLVCMSALLLILAAGCNSANGVGSPMIGFWADSNNITTTLEMQNGILTAVSVYDVNQPQGKNLLVESSFGYGRVNWRYCLPDQTCTTISTVSVSGDTLTVDSTNNQGVKTQAVLKRVTKGTP